MSNSTSDEQNWSQYLLLDLKSHTFEQGSDLSRSPAAEHDGPLTAAQTVLAPPPGCSTGAAGAEHEPAVSEVQPGSELASASPADVAVDPLGAILTRHWRDL